MLLSVEEELINIMVDMHTYVVEINKIAYWLPKNSEQQMFNKFCLRLQVTHSHIVEEYFSHISVRYNGIEPDTE